MDEATSATVWRSFGYCFHQAPGSSYPPFCLERRIVHPEPFEIDGPGGTIDVRTVRAEHGDIHALGFRIGGVVYLPDVQARRRRGESRGARRHRRADRRRAAPPAARRRT